MPVSLAATSHIAAKVSVVLTCFATQIIETFTTLHDFINVVLHDIDDFVDLGLDTLRFGRAGIVARLR